MERTHSPVSLARFSSFGAPVSGKDTCANAAAQVLELGMGGVLEVDHVSKEKIETWRMIFRSL